MIDVEVIPKQSAPGGTIMRLLLAIGLALAAAIPALAAPQDPVRTLLDLASRTFKGSRSATPDYFSAERLATLYSKDFVARYKAATTMMNDSEDRVLDRDLLTREPSDSCPFEDVKISVGPTDKGITQVLTSFMPYNCKEGDPIQGEIRTVTFVVKREDGRDVIDDIIHTFSTKYAFDRYEGL
jgi:hypothetical protein